MRRIASYGPLFRAVAVFGAVGVLVTSVTYAQLQSQQAVLTGNSIQSATADLRIGTSTSTFSATRTGFTFANVVPGGPAMPADGNIFYLKNYGSLPLALKVSIGSTPTNAANIDLNKVSLVLTRVDSGVEQTLSVQQLVDSNTAGGVSVTDTLAAGTVGQYKLRAIMTADAFSGNGVDTTVGGIDLVFSGIPAE